MSKGNFPPAEEGGAHGSSVRAARGVAHREIHALHGHFVVDVDGLNCRRHLGLPFSVFTHLPSSRRFDDATPRANSRPTSRLKVLRPRIFLSRPFFIIKHP